VLSLWPWLLGALALVVLVAIVVRRRLRFYWRVARSLTTDERLPRPLRWTVVACFAIKAVPVPDFGLDEAALAVIAVLLATVYRPTFRAIVAEQRQLHLQEGAQA
jgi:membrane protein implicated in regulation of membrane protease activity